MARRISRRPKVVWLPMDRNNRLGVAGGATLGTDSAMFQINVGAGSGLIGATNTVVIPVVGDAPQLLALAGSPAGPSLSDYEGSAYRLRRIVGKLFVSIDNTALDATAASTVVITCGFIVLRVDDLGVPINVTTDAYAPAALDGIRDPWIWRRSWVLTNLVQFATIAGAGFQPFPTTNADYGSVADGPHVDAKTARVIADEERLFFVAQATNRDGTGGQGQNLIIITGDLRVLASMRSSQGNRRNASR